MRKRAFLSVLFAAMVLITGCATLPREPLRAQRTSAVILAPKDKVWPVLVAEVGLNCPVQAIEKESGLITTQFIQMPVGFNNIGMERYVFPPGNFFATWAGLRMCMRILVVESEPGKTKVTINAHYEAFENNVSKSWMVARSNGSVENKILTGIEQGTLAVKAPPIEMPVEYRLKRTKELLDQKVITEEEYASNRKIILASLSDITIKDTNTESRSNETQKANVDASKSAANKVEETQNTNQAGVTANNGSSKVDNTESRMADKQESSNNQTKPNNKSEGSFTFPYQGGIDIKASYREMKDFEKHGRNQYFIHLVPMIKDTRGNIYAASLACVQNIFQVYYGQGGLFYNDIKLLHDEIFNINAYYYGQLPTGKGLYVTGLMYEKENSDNIGGFVIYLK